VKKIISFIYTIYFLLIGFLCVFNTFIIAKIFTIILRDKRYKLIRLIYKIQSMLLLFVLFLYPYDKKKSFPKGIYIYCMNHQSDLDIILSLAILPAGFLFVAKEELLKMPLIGSLISMAGYITINRKNARKSTETLDKITQEINFGNSVLIFPEGTRTIDGEIQSIKRGSLLVAFQTKTPILPVVNDNLYKIFNKKEKKVTFQKIKINIGQKIIYDWHNNAREYSLESANNLENIMKTMLLELRQ
jgi:1-acyl-sn-glycerol-3-phosphate acyltransferase